MATNQRRNNQSTYANRNQQGQNRPVSQAKAMAKKKKSKVKLIVFAIEIVVILIMLTVLYFVLHISDKGPIWMVIDPEELAIPDEITQGKLDGSSQMAGYMNIALFGVDALNEKQFRKLQNNEKQDGDGAKSTGIRSDSTMIASVNLATGDIKLVSLYRDTYLNIGTDSYQKCNAAFSKGGPKQAMKMLNMNLDLDIEKFVAVSYGGVIELIDALGGVWIDVDKSELNHINNYQRSIVASWKYGVQLTDDSDPSVFNVVKKDDYTPVTETGYQLLNGLQATAYCRIRYTAGNDYKRAERQREVLAAIETQAKALAKKNPAELTKIFNSVIENVCTNIEVKDMLVLLEKILDYQIVAQDGFPQADLRISKNIGAKGDCIIPRDLEANVVWLHKFLFEEEDYEVTTTVKKINQKIKDDTDKYLNNQQ